MKYLSGKNYVEEKDKRNIIPLENIILREREERKSLRTHNQVINDTMIRKNQKVIGNQKDDLEVKPY